MTRILSPQTCAFTQVTSEEDVTRALDMAVDKFGSQVNAAVNCAGIGVAAKTLGKKGVHSLAAFEKTLGVNAVGSFNVIRLAAERMSLGEPFDEDGGRGSRWRGQRRRELYLPLRLSSVQHRSNESNFEHQ